MISQRSILFGAVAMLLSGCNDPKAQGNQPTAKPPSAQVLEVKTVKKEEITLDSDLLRTNYLVVLDNSGSMKERACGTNESRFSVAKKAVSNFAMSLKGEENLALAVFSGKTAKIIVPFGHTKTNREMFVNTVKGLSSEEGTPLTGALEFARNEMNNRFKAQLGYGVYRIVVITDGESMDGDPSKIAREIGASPIELHIIGFCLGKDGDKHSLNIRGYTRYSAAQDPEQLEKGLRSATAETNSFDASRL